jgi:hypothetical protein
LADIADEEQGLGAAGEGAVPDTLSREELYEMVWREPMLRVAERFGLSSSYLARVCTDLRVPWPRPGHWSKLEFGKTSPQPPLPAYRMGDADSWTRAETPPPRRRLDVPEAGEESTPVLISQSTRAASTKQEDVRGPAHDAGASAEPAAPAEARSPAAAPDEPARARRRRGKHIPADAKHELLTDVRGHFLKTRGHETGLLRPFKRILADITLSGALLDNTLDLANQLYLKFESRAHHVLIPAPVKNYRSFRMSVDEREVPTASRWHHEVWVPERPTLVYFDDVPFGPWIFEMTENVEMLYVRGDYLPVRSLTDVQRARLANVHTFTTHNPLLTGRRCLQVYSAHGRFKWSRQWREKKPGQLLKMLPDVVSLLEDVVPEVRVGVEKANLEAEEEQRKRDAEWAAYELREKLAREAKNRQSARTDFLAAIGAWEEARRIHDFFNAVEHQAQGLDDSSREHLEGRLELARELVGTLDPLAVLASWKAPMER